MVVVSALLSSSPLRGCLPGGSPPPSPLWLGVRPFLPSPRGVNLLPPSVVVRPLSPPAVAPPAFQWGDGSGVGCGVVGSCVVGWFGGLWWFGVVWCVGFGGWVAGRGWVVSVAV